MSDAHNQDPDFEQLEGAGDDPSAIPTWYGGIVFTILFVVSAYLLVFLTGIEEEAVLEDRLRYKSRELEEVQGIQNSQLSSYTWTDRDNNRVSIPLEQGKNEVLRRYGKQGN
ncbi:MAG: hypothetical protein CBC13_03310 [Planctomycetia bacterium TMED53]|nr:MAG: hypothetical protein CBC13_03310 [Planctomycetia bacterium TMED53]